MTETVLTLNAGSSSVKFALYRYHGELEQAPILKGQVSGLNDAPALRIEDRNGSVLDNALGREDADSHQAAINCLLREISVRMEGASVIAVGHRVVHGGLQFSAPVIASEAVITALEAFSPLAPGHQPHNLGGLKTAQAHWPSVPHVACFDTAFHRTQPHIAEQFAIPRALAQKGVIRYGFHGLSYDYIASAAPSLMKGAAHERMIVAHLGGGASMCAMKAGKSIATTMGFSALDGLPMGTRCGDLDPGVILYLLQEKGMSADAIADCLYMQSGLLGMSGISPDMRTLEASDDPRAEEAIAYFAHRCVREIGALAAALGGLDALVFTAGVGENAAPFRARVIKGCEWLGFRLDEAANANHEARITAAGAGPSAWVIPTNEELMIARETVRLI